MIFLGICGISLFGQEKEEALEKVEILDETPAGIEAQFRLGEFERTRTLHDLDGDGWCDLWCAVFPEVEHRNKVRDTDGDGLTDYEEMVLMRDPINKGPMPRNLTAAEIKKNEQLAKEQAENREKVFKERKKAFSSFILNAEAVQEGRKSKAEKLADIPLQLNKKKAAQDAAINQAAQTLDIPTKGFDSNGRFFHLESFDGSTVDMKRGHNFRSADTIATDELLPPVSGLPGGSSGLNLTGAGQTVGIWDEADVLTNHTEMNGRVTDIDGTSGTNQHATHVAGTMIASGVQTLARGMSPSALLDSADFQDDLLEIPPAVAGGLNLSNHSYGFLRGWELGTSNGQPVWLWWGETTVSQTEDYRFGFYSDFSRFVDEVAFDAQTFLPVWSAGNERGSQGPNGSVGHFALVNGNFQFVAGFRPRDQNQPVNPGYDLISDYSVAKNTLTVAAVEDIFGGYSSPGSVIMSTFSSFGPVDDGRVKPDISANGVNVTSTFDNGGYGVFSGTSMAAPSVTGSINLLREHWENLFGDSADVWASTWKGLVLHTADESGSSPGPDYRFGWGLMNSQESAEIISDQSAEADSLPYLKEVRLESGDFIEFTVTAIGGEPLKVTCCWTDPEGTVPPPALDVDVAALVNDLDVRIIDGSTTFFPWKLDPANPTAAATRSGDNNRDNVEQVLIDNPVAGREYTVQVTHKGNLVDDTQVVSSQNLSLILSGHVAAPAPVLEFTELVQTGTNEFTGFWSTVVGDRYDVESSTDLQTWTVEIADVSPTKELSAVVLPTGGVDKKFWRLRRNQ